MKINYQSLCLSPYVLIAIPLFHPLVQGWQFIATGGYWKTVLAFSTRSPNGQPVLGCEAFDRRSTNLLVQQPQTQPALLALPPVPGS